MRKLLHITKNGIRSVAASDDRVPGLKPAALRSFLA